MGNDQGSAAGFGLLDDRVPAFDGPPPNVIEVFAFGHLYRFGLGLPCLQKSRIARFDFCFELAFPEAVTDFPEGFGGLQGHLRVVSQDQLGGFLRAGHGAADGGIDRHGLEKFPGLAGLVAAIVVEWNVDLALEAAFAVPLGFAVAHEEEANRLVVTHFRDRFAEVGGEVDRFELHRVAEAAGKIQDADAAVRLVEGLVGGGAKADRGVDQGPVDPAVADDEDGFARIGWEDGLPEGLRPIVQILGGIEGLPIGSGHGERSGVAPPVVVLLGVLRHHFLEVQPFPLREVDFFDPIVGLERWGIGQLGQNLGGGLVGALEGAAVGRIDR